MKYDKIAILSIILCTTIIFGEIVVYAVNPFSCDADVEWEDDEVNYSVTASVVDTYSVILMDNGNVAAPKTLYIYVDERYDKFYGDLDDETIQYIDTEHHSLQLMNLLKIRGLNDVHLIRGDEIDEIMKDEHPQTKGLLVMSFFLPASVYDGTASSPLLKWIEAGGLLYWTGSEAGGYYVLEDELKRVTGNQLLLFGEECINTSEVDIIQPQMDTDDLTEALALKWNRIRYGLDVSNIPGSLSMGFTYDGYSSVAMVPRGDGMICVIGGTSIDRIKCDDIAQVISSGITCSTNVLEIGHGTVKRGTSSDVMELNGTSSDLRLMIYVGGYYTIFGISFDRYDIVEGA